MYDYSKCTNRDVICVDLKSFFASVSCIEKGLNPLETKLAVVADTKRKGAVVLASTPPLKKLGVKTGTRLFEIPQRNDIYIINPSMRKYLEISTKISQILLRYVAPEDFLQYSIDEAFLDITDSYFLFANTPFDLAIEIQKAILKETKILSTIGIGSNPLLAKLSMDFEAKKTRCGIAEWRYQDVPNKLWHVEKLTDMWGINKRTEAKLNKKGIFTIGHLANYPVAYLRRDLGSIGVDLHLHANGIDESIIRNRSKTKNKSYGKSQVLMRDYSKDELKTVLIEQIDEVFYRVRNLNLYPTCISVSIGYADNGGVRKQFTNKNGYHNTSTILNEIWHYLSGRLEQDRLYRNLGISLSKCVSKQIRQLSLFENPLHVKKEIIDNQLDVIRYKYGKDIVMKGVSLTKSGTLVSRKGLLGGHKS